MLPDEHKQLSINLKNRSNWILSYDDEIEIRELYKDNKIIDLEAHYSINGKKKEWSNKNELIILNQ
jgi:hypothetical protein